MTTRRTLAAGLKVLRPRQWTKNLILFLPLIFAGEIASLRTVLEVTAAFVVFCGISGAVYIGNDLSDRESDRLHEIKCLRPIACGELSTTAAWVMLGVLLPVSLAGAFLIGTSFGLVTLTFLALQFAYTWRLKHEVILDVMAISAGFVLRAFAGAAVIGTAGSPWLYVCAALLALFLGFAKRRHELVLLEEGAHSHRVSLAEYTPDLLDAILSSVTAATIVTYSLYTFFSATGERHQYLMLTVPFVAYGMFRYLYLIYKRNLGGSPEEILLTDAPLILDIVLWLVAVFVVVYLT